MSSSALDQFVREVGTADPVCVAGSRTQWDVGGHPDPGTREVRAPVGVMSFQPAEMIVEVGAGTRFADLDAVVAESGQEVVLGPADRAATVGGLLAVGHSGLRRLRHGHVRDILLRARFVDGAGRLITAGGGTVKNVAGYDLCRLLVGSLGTLGLLGEVLLRTRPRPEVVVWYRGALPPRDVAPRLYRPATILWDGTTTWVQLEGHRGDVGAEGELCQAAGMVETPGPPALPPHRWSVDPAELATVVSAGGGCVAEVGVGVVHRHDAQPAAPVPAPIQALTERVRAAVDPQRRLNPGRQPPAGAVTAVPR